MKKKRRDGNSKLKGISVKRLNWRVSVQATSRPMAVPSEKDDSTTDMASYRYTRVTCDLERPKDRKMPNSREFSLNKRGRV